MNTTAFFHSIVEPTIQIMARMPDINIRASDEARVLVMAVAGQESDWKWRRQVGISNYYPQKVGARSYWQMESTWGGPVAINDIFQRAPRQLKSICDMLNIPFDEYAVYEACAWNDTLACALARLLLWIDPAPLPAIGAVEMAWQYYLRGWRPSLPHPEKWPDAYDLATRAVLGDKRDQLKLGV